MGKKIVLQSMRIKDVGPIDDLELLLNKEEDYRDPTDFFVLYGANGSGKSTILCIIKELLSLAQKSSKNPFYLDRYNNKLILGSMPGFAVLTIRIIEEDRFNSIDIFICRDPDLFENEVRSIIGDTYVGGVWNKKINGYNEVKSDNFVPFEDDELRVLFTYPAQRSFAFFYKTYPDHYFDNSIISFINEELEDIGKSLFLDEKKMKLSRKEPFSDFLFFRDHLDKTHELKNLSNGEDFFISFLFEIMNGLKNNNIILIDELESSFHETFQIRLIDAFKKIIKMDNFFQFVITSHSWVLIEECGHRAIRILPDPNGIRYK